MTTDRSVFSRVIAVHNGKGGVLKTTIAANAAAQLAASIKVRVLVIDLETQDEDGGVARLFGVAHASDKGRELHDALVEGRPFNPDEFLEPRDNLHLLCGGEFAEKLQFPDIEETGWSVGQFMDRFAESLAPIVDDYDFIFIDTPPGSRFFILGAMSCAKYVIIPTKADVQSIRGMHSAFERIEQAQDRNPFIRPMGIVLTDIGTSSTVHEDDTRQFINKALGSTDELFRFAIHHAEKIAAIAPLEGRLYHEMAHDEEARAEAIKQAAFARLQARRSAEAKRRREAKTLGVPPDDLPLDFDESKYPTPRSYAGASKVAAEIAGIVRELYDRIAATEAQEEAEVQK